MDEDGFNVLSELLIVYLQTLGKNKHGVLHIILEEGEVLGECVQDFGEHLNQLLVLEPIEYV